MCGISGIVSITGKAEESFVKKMNDAVRHRGPDGEGIWKNPEGNVCLGHRRLSIIDLSDAGRQPMHYNDRYTLIFNGEIYNYIELKENLSKSGAVFNSQSDTEVLLALYDKYRENCLAYLDGMFAFALYDNKEKTLFCARDRFGEKPFYYYYRESESFYFGSEMKALWAGGVKKEVNNQMLFHYLTTGFLQNTSNPSETFYTGIQKLGAAHFLILDVVHCKIKSTNRYWSLQPEIKEPGNLDTVIETFSSLFETSVRRRMRSDVPVGSSLSGGLDSSLVVMTIDKIKKGTNQIQKTFSARFPGFYKDEGKYMEMVIDRCDVEPHFTYPDGKIILQDVEKIFYYQEEPFGSASICAQYEVMKLARQNSVIVLQDGQGADEILAGYHAYFPPYLLELKKKDPQKWITEKMAFEKLHRDNPINPLPKKDLKYYARNYATMPFNVLKKINKTLSKSVQPGFSREFFLQYKKGATGHVPTHSTLNDSLVYSTSTYGLEQLLRYADRNSMANSVEVRLPFLSHELVEYLFTLPSHYKIRNGWTKWIMRQAYQSILPPEIVWRKDKIGYEPPQKDWMEDKSIKELIFEKRKQLVNSGILNKNVLNYTVKAELVGDNKTNSWVHWMAGNLISK